MTAAPGPVPEGGASVSGPDPAGPAGTADPDVASDTGREVAEIVGRLGEDGVTRSEQSRLLVRLGQVTASRAQQAGIRAVGSGKYLADMLLEAVPHIPVRDLPTLQQHHEGLSGEALADALVRNARRTTAGIGAAGGAVAAAEWAAAPLLITVPLEVVVETLAVAAVEVKLVAELHAVYGVEVDGTGTQRAMAFTGAWANRRGIDPLKPWTIPQVLGIAGRQQLAKRMLQRFARNLGSIIPFFVGAVVGARVNWTETDRLGLQLRTDLRRVSPWGVAAGDDDAPGAPVVPPA